MHIDKVQYNTNLSQRVSLKKQPNFKGLYFATPEVRQITTTKNFVHFLNNPDIREIIKKYNILITKINFEKPKSNSSNGTCTPDGSFEYLATTSVKEKDGTGYVKDGLWSRNYKYENGNENNSIMSFAVRHFNERLSAKPFMNNILFHDKSLKDLILSEPFFDDVLNNKNIQASLKSGNKLFFRGTERFCLAKDFVEEHGQLEPSGFRTRYYDVCALDKFYDYLDCGDYFNKIIFQNENDKENFLHSEVAENFWKSGGIKETIDKYNLFVTIPSYSKIEVFASTDVVQDGDKVLPAGYVTPKYEITKKVENYSQRLVEYLDFLTKYTGNSSDGIENED